MLAGVSAPQPKVPKFLVVHQQISGRYLLAFLLLCGTKCLLKYSIIIFLAFCPLGLPYQNSLLRPLLLSGPSRPFTPVYNTFGPRIFALLTCLPSVKVSQSPPGQRTLCSVPVDWVESVPKFLHVRAGLADVIWHGPSKYQEFIFALTNASCRQGTVFFFFNQNLQGRYFQISDEKTKAQKIE